MFTVDPRSASVALLRMDDGKVNAIGPTFLRDFDRAWTEATGDQRAVVLAGGAKAFSAGLDLKVLPTLKEEDLVAFLRGFVRFMGALANHPRPLVAAVDGPALAGGAIMALCSDLRLVSPAARLGVIEMPVGIPFPPPVLDLLEHALPRHELGPAVFQGIIREGEDCVRTGWAHRLVPRERLLDEAARTAEELASFNPRAYAMAKAQLRSKLAASIARFDKDVGTYAEALTDPDTIAHVAGYFARVVGQRGARP